MIKVTCNVQKYLHYYKSHAGIAVILHGVMNVGQSGPDVLKKESFFFFFFCDSRNSRDHHRRGLVT